MDTSADTKRSVRDAFNASYVVKNSVNSILVGWYGCPLTPETGVQVPVGLPIKLITYKIRHSRQAGVCP